MIFIILPIYNEENNIYKLIGKLRDTMSGQTYKIIAVNDGSVDKSLDILNKLCGSDMLIESYLINMNVGSAFSTGFERALSESKKDDDIVLIMESDQTSSIDLISSMILEISEKKNDVVIASRYQKGGGYLNFPLSRRIFSRGANYLMRFYFPISDNVHDYSIFFRAYRIGILRQGIKYFGNFGLIQSKGFVANTELLIKLSALTNGISEVPFKYDYGKKKGGSKLKVLKTIYEYFAIIPYLKNILKKLKTFEIASESKAL